MLIHPNKKMRMKPFFFSLFSSSLFLLFVLSIHGTHAQNLIHDTCKISSKGDPNLNYTFCVTSLQAAPASRCASLRDLGTISVQLVGYNVTDARCHIKQLLKNKKLDSFMQACLNDCFKLYADAIESVKKAKKFYKSRQFGDANVVIASIMDAANTCEDGFKEKKVVVSPLTKRNNDTFQLSAMALSIMKIL